MLQRPHRRYLPVFLHILGWALIVPPLLFQPRGWSVDIPNEFWIKQWILLGLLIGAFYLNSHILLPKLLFKNHTLGYILAIGGVVVTIYWTINFVEIWLNLPELWHKALHPEKPFNPNRPRRFDSFTFLYSMLALGASTSITVVQKWQKDTQIKEQLEREKVSSELSFLKAQINPHFFFNTLNNIYALTMIDADTAREALHRLSRMMRYVLYETQETTTLLSKEIAFLQDYIQLMQLRLTDKVKVNFVYPKPLQDIAVAPMLLLTFVENAFKHGISATQESFINISIEQEGNQLSVEVRNSVFENKSQNLEESNGIGLVNTRRRLDLLYPNRYQLESGQQGEEFVVKLQLSTAKTKTLEPVTA
ncbi:MAG: sensor histidine kinase [Runella sp.]